MRTFFTLHTKSIKAFTLLEVLASFSIVTLVILGPLTFSINSASYSRQAKDVLTAQYLAQESLELLHYQHDTLYIACANEKDACDTATVPTLDGETRGGKAWRIFKNRLDSGSFSCFSADGCSYDFLDMLDATNIAVPARYSPSGAVCPGLSMVYSTVIGYDTIVRNYYVCSGVDQADIGDKLKDDHFAVKKTTYLRKINIESVPTFTEINSPSAPANLLLYQDDLIVTATVSFRRSNGIMRHIKVTDFFHARS